MHKERVEVRFDLFEFCLLGMEGKGRWGGFAGFDGAGEEVEGEEFHVCFSCLSSLFGLRMIGISLVWISVKLMSLLKEVRGKEIQNAPIKSQHFLSLAWNRLPHLEHHHHASLQTLRQQNKMSAEPDTPPQAPSGAQDARDPSGFLSEIIGAPVTVKLNSGVVYRGMEDIYLCRWYV